MQGGQNWILPKEMNANGPPRKILIGWKSGKTSMRPGSAFQIWTYPLVPVTFLVNLYSLKTMLNVDPKIFSQIPRGRLWNYTLGGFNVSNLMGITRRKIDIGKKITFYFLQNVWKCTVFFAFAFKVCKKCYYDPQKFFLEKYHYGYPKRRILCWFQIRWCRLKQMPLEKARAKKLCEFW
jgi:hypothetical protein